MNGFDYFKLALSKYAIFEGRSRRSEYWYFVLFNILAGIAAGIVDEFFGFPVIGTIVSLALFIPGLAVGVRRLHDIGKSGWNLLFILIPLVGLIILLVWLCKDSEAGSNKYGPNPKGEGNEILDHLVEDNELV
ncbi:MAG: DUF805 domain-containing protein [Saprospiraceae bacterium]|nr:DUF805 domain-containing protein [Saprospiraceae bacterium]